MNPVEASGWRAYAGEAVRARTGMVQALIGALHAAAPAGDGYGSGRGDVYEFGVNTGGGLKRVLDLFGQHGIEVGHVWGFDSFEGLPQDTSAQQSASKYNALEQEGAFSVKKDTGGEAYPLVEKQLLDFIGYANTTLVKGYFDATLTDSLASVRGMRPAFFVSIDCDLYSSTKVALEWLVGNKILVPGTFVYYDEFDDGEGPAHKEVSDKYGLKWKVLYDLAVDAKENSCCGERTLFQLVSM